MSHAPRYCCAFIYQPPTTSGENTHILMEQRPATASYAAGRLCCYGGARHDDPHDTETPLACIQRELYEELHWHISDANLRHVHTLNDDTQCLAWFYICTLDVPLSDLRSEIGHSMVSVPLAQRHRYPISDWHRMVLDHHLAGITSTNLSDYHYGHYLRPQHSQGSPNNPPWIVSSSRTVYQNQWSKITEDQLIANDPHSHTDTDPRTGSYTYFAAKDSVVICPLFDNNDTTLVRQWRHVQQCHTWELPCGAIEQGETALAAAERELAEECHLHAEKWEAHGSLSHSDARIAGRIYFFTARQLRILDAHHAPAADDSESDMHSLRLAFSEALAAVHHGDIDTMLSTYFIQCLATQIHPQTLMQPHPQTAATNTETTP